MWPFLTNHNNMDTFSWFYPHQTWSSAVCSRPRKMSFASQFHLFSFASRMPFLSSKIAGLSTPIHVHQWYRPLSQCWRAKWDDGGGTAVRPPPKNIDPFSPWKKIGQMKIPAIDIAFFCFKESLLLERVTGIVHRYGFLYGWQFNNQSSPGDKWSTNRQWIHQWNLKFVVIRSSILNFLRFRNNYYFGVEWELQFLVCFFAMWSFLCFLLIIFPWQRSLRAVCPRARCPPCESCATFCSELGSQVVSLSPAAPRRVSSQDASRSRYVCSDLDLNPWGAYLPTFKPIFFAIFFSSSPNFPVSCNLSLGKLSVGRECEFFRGSCPTKGAM